MSDRFAFLRGGASFDASPEAIMPLRRRPDGLLSVTCPQELSTSERPPLSKIRTLYARIVLWLIRPALELRKPAGKDLNDIVLDIMIKDAERNGPFTRRSRGAR
jgi:hypothetical protein